MPDLLHLVAPLSGVVYPLECVPDPVFAQKIVGDGVSIDPTDSCLRAPCAGEVVNLHPAHHALSLRSPEGVEVLMHIGIDTVQLKGAGFTPRVKVGDKVETGAALIDFDLDEVATHAKSLLTQIVIANGESVSSMERASGLVKVSVDNLLKLTLASGKAGAAATAGSVESGETVTSELIAIPNETGLHARPAATLANAAKGFQSEIKLKLDDRTANARSITSIMTLEVEHGSQVQVIATGPDARQAVESLAKLIASGLGDEVSAAPVVPAAKAIAKPVAEPPPRRRSSNPNELLGVGASPGLGVGQVFQVRHVDVDVEEKGGGVEKEKASLAEATNKARAQIEALKDELEAKGNTSRAAIFAAHAELLADPDFLDIATTAIDQGKSAAFAWKSAVEVHAQRLASLRNELLAQRANDVRDVGSRVLSLLTGIEPQAPDYPENSILIAEDLTPSDTAAMERGRVVGFATVRGGATSHVAILARSMDIPAIAGIESAALEIASGTTVVLDGSKGVIRIDPPPQEVTHPAASYRAGKTPPGRCGACPGASHHR